VAIKSSKVDIRTVVKRKAMGQLLTLAIFDGWRNHFKGTQSVKTSINEYKWKVLSDTISKYKVKTVLEFGAGLSTILFDSLELLVDSYETSAEYLDEIRSLCSRRIRIQPWDNVNLKILSHYDLALVDGIMPRANQANLAFNHAKLVAIDDFECKSSRGVKIPNNVVRIDDKLTKLAIFIKEND
jgi:hypothetical protein